MIEEELKLNKSICSLIQIFLKYLTGVRLPIGWQVQKSESGKPHKSAIRRGEART